MMLLHWKLTGNKKKSLFKTASGAFETILLSSTYIFLYWDSSWAYSISDAWLTFSPTNFTRRITQMDNRAQLDA